MSESKWWASKYPKLELYHYSSKRWERVVTTPTTRWACWILSKLQITLNSRLQPAEHPLRENYRQHLQLQCSLNEIKGAVDTFRAAIKYFSRFFQSLHLDTHIFQPHSQHFLRNVPFQWKRGKEGVCPCKRFHQKVFSSALAKDKVTQTLPSAKNPAGLTNIKRPVNVL